MDWMKDLPDELRANETLKQYKSIEDVAKGLVETKAMVGRSIRVPGENASADDRSAFIEDLTTKLPELMKRPADDDPEFWKTFGTPESADKYEVPEGVTLPDGSEAVMRELFLKAKLSKKQASAMLSEMGERGKEVLQQSESQKLETEKALRGEWGAAFDERQRIADKVKEKFGVEGDPRKLYELGKVMMSGEAEFGDQPESESKMSPAEAERQISEIMANPAHWDQSDPRYPALMKRRMELESMANPSASVDPASLRSL